jgi:hypothetical protein
MHGHGSFTQTTGLIFDGHYKNGKKHGYGEIYFPDGSMLQG